MIAVSVMVIGASLVTVGCGLAYYSVRASSRAVWVAGEPLMVDEGVIDLWGAVHAELGAALCG